MTQRIESFFDMTQRFFFWKITQELNFFFADDSKYFFKKNDPKNSTLFLKKHDSKIWSFFLVWLKDFSKYDSKNFFSLNKCDSKKLNFFWTLLEELNTFYIHSKNWTHFS